ncbi:hypothetical protein JCM19039_4560 [Geomicrobium sp. JCM 19039]|nr:hypothetical protein JCM19039_4560 [Geomicrobium sp. JCM 19039]
MTRADVSLALLTEKGRKISCAKRMVRRFMQLQYQELVNFFRATYLDRKRADLDRFPD